MPDNTIKRTIKKKKKSMAKQYKKGAKLVVKGTKQLASTGTSTSKQVSKSVKSGELRGGVKKSTRYKAEGAKHKIASGNKMMAGAEQGTVVKKTTQMNRLAPGFKEGTTVNRKGKVTKRKMR